MQIECGLKARGIRCFAPNRQDYSPSGAGHATFEALLHRHHSGIGSKKGGKCLLVLKACLDHESPNVKLFQDYFGLVGAIMKVFERFTVLFKVKQGQGLNRLDSYSILSNIVARSIH